MIDYTHEEVILTYVLAVLMGLFMNTVRRVLETKKVGF